MTQQSPVVPSVGAVPVEVPEEGVEAVYRAFTGKPAIPTFLDLEEWAGTTRKVWAELAPLIAARVRAEERRRAVTALYQEALRVSDVPPDPIRTEAYWAGRVEGVLAAKTLVAKTLAAGSAVPVATPGQDPPQVHVVPAVSSDHRVHEMTDGCWCHPLNEFLPTRLGGRNEWRITHRPDGVPDRA